MRSRGACPFGCRRGRTGAVRDGRLRHPGCGVCGHGWSRRLPRGERRRSERARRLRSGARAGRTATARPEQLPGRLARVGTAGDRRGRGVRQQRSQAWDPQREDARRRDEADADQGDVEPGQDGGSHAGEANDTSAASGLVDEDRPWGSISHVICDTDVQRSGVTPSTAGSGRIVVFGRIWIQLGPTTSRVNFGCAAGLPMP
jgi:hypothetical protein